MATTFQGARILWDASIGSQTEVLQGDLVDGGETIQELDWQKWLLEVTLEQDRNGAKGHGADVFMHHLLNSATPFTMPMPPWPGVTPPSGSFELTSGGAAAKGAMSLTVRRASGDTSLPKLAFFTLAGDPKVYAVAATTSVSSPASVPIFPALMRPATGGTDLDFTPNITVVYEPQSIKRAEFSRNVYRPTRRLREWLQP